MEEYNLRPKSSLNNPSSLPSNSNIRKVSRGSAQTRQPTSKPVVKGNITIRKKNLLERLDIPGIVEDVVRNKVIPNVEDILFDTATTVLSSAIYGDTNPARTVRRPNQTRGNGYVSYRNAYDNRRDTRPVNSPISNYDPYDFIFSSREDAQNIFYALGNLLDQYGQASVGDLYDLANMTISGTMNNYGWYNLDDSRIRMVRDGYMLILPKPVLLDRP